MPADPRALTPESLPDAVERIIADVLMVPRQRVQPAVRLIRDLGAESLDFLDLVFRLEELLGREVSIDRWRAFVADHTRERDPAEVLTAAFVVRFARAELERP